MDISRYGIHSFKKGAEKPAFTYLVGKRDSEIQYLAIQFPFSLVLHVGDLHFNCNRTLEKGKKRKAQDSSI